MAIVMSGIFPAVFILNVPKSDGKIKNMIKFLQKIYDICAEIIYRL